MTYNTIIVLAGACLLGALCGAVGSFAVLRRRALMGDVMAHAALPGLPLAFLLAGGKSLPILLTGAAASILLGMGWFAAMRYRTRTHDDAAMALVLASMFGLGIVLLRHVQNVSTGGHAGLESFIFGKTAGMVASDVWITGGVALVCLGVIAVAYKELRLVCFDPGFAASTGLRVGWVDFLITGLLVLAVVVGLPMVGVVMVAALTIIPAVAARFWTESLGPMLGIASVFGALACALGVLVSASQERMPSGPLIVLAAAVLFVLSALFAPQRGLVARRLRLERLRHAWREGRLEA